MLINFWLNKISLTIIIFIVAMCDASQYDLINEKNSSITNISNFNSTIPFDSRNSVTFEDCHNGIVKDVSVSGCNKDLHVCTFYNGQRHSIGMDFVPDSDWNEVVANARASVLGFITLEMPERDVPVCELGLVPCPLAAGRRYRFENRRLDVDVPWWAPKRIFKRFLLTALLQDRSTKQIIACMRMNATIDF